MNWRSSMSCFFVTLYLSQRISMAMQRRNAASLLGTITPDSDAKKFNDA